MDAQRLRGMAVVTMAEAERVGLVRDVLFQAAPLRAGALQLETASGQRLIALSDIRNVGDTVIVADDREAALLSEARLKPEELRGLGELMTLKVIDERGSLVGVITRVDIDPATGDVTCIDVTKRNALGLAHETTTLGPDQIQSVGSGLVTVRRT